MKTKATKTTKEKINTESCIKSKKEEKRNARSQTDTCVKDNADKVEANNTAAKKLDMYIERMTNEIKKIEKENEKWYAKIQSLL